MIHSDYLVFDCETGGLVPSANPITQFAALVIDGRTLREIDRWETYVQPYAGLTIDPAAIEGTMVRMSDVNGGLKVEDFVGTLVRFLEQHQTHTRIRNMGRLVPVGHNVTFDLGFVTFALKVCGREGLDEWLYPNFIDTYALAKMTWGVTGVEKLNLGACCDRAHVSLVGAHGAMADAEATANLLRWYVRKLRRTGAVETTSADRAKGRAFFEFSCK